MKKSLKKAIQEYRNSRLPVSFNFKMACKDLFKKKKIIFERKNHYIHQYPGRIYPYIPLYFLSIADFSEHNGYILDPFSGSGTVLIESITNPIVKRKALGIEINPLARLITKVKISDIDISNVDSYLKEIKGYYSHKRKAGEFIPQYGNINLWFSKVSQERLARLRYAINKISIPCDYKDLFWISFSGVIRKVSRADPYIPPPVVLKLKKYKKNPKKHQRLKRFIKEAENPEVWKIFEHNVKSNVRKLKRIEKSKEIEKKKIAARIIWDDAKNIKNGEMLECGRIKKRNKRKLKSSSIDIILTSPPYLTAQKYIRTTKLELLWLGYGEKEINNLDKTIIGSERISTKTEISKLGIRTIDSLINRTICKSKERGLMVYCYFENMIKVIDEMYRILKKGRYAILILGDNKVLGRRVKTYRLLTDAAIKVGFTEIAILQDKIRTRSMMTKRNGTGGLIRNEYIVLLSKGEQ